MSADDIGFDMMEQILIRSDAGDLMRCKGVCKSWHSLISTPFFVESYLKRTFNEEDPKRNKRIFNGVSSNSSFLSENELFVVGSANGLICVSPKDFELLIVNPCTRQTIKINQPPPEPLPKTGHRWCMVWGFGYDSSNDDYKIVLGLMKGLMRMRFYVLSLKSCRWKFIEENDYILSNGNSVISGILCDGALHWRMQNLQTKEEVILSFNLFREKFTKTQPPDDHSLYDKSFWNTLGVIEESLCLHEYEADRNDPSIKIRVLRSDNSGKQYWVLLPDNYVYVMNYDALYYIDDDDYSIDIYKHSGKQSWLLSRIPEYICSPIYVRSLASPYVNMDSTSKLVGRPAQMM